MKKILFIVMIMMFSTLSCFDGINDAYNTKSGPSMVFVSGGTFQRDSGAANISTVSSFYMSQFEVTRAQYVAVTGLADITDPTWLGKAPTTDSPRTIVNWYGALVFCNRLSMLEGRTPVYTIAGSTDPSVWIAATGGVIPIDNVTPTNNAIWNAVVANFHVDGYRLPTEMEWMWAAMGGNSDSKAGDIASGVNILGYTKLFAGSTGTNLTGDYAVFGFGSSDLGRTTTERTNPVGSKLPNEIGLYDMSGNVWEWCWDRFDGVNDKDPYTITGLRSDYSGPDSGTTRVIRGGTYESDISVGRLNVEYRQGTSPYGRGSDGGFRVVRR